MALWNPWHGCRKLSEGCQNCYVYRGDAKHGRDGSVVYKTGGFDLPVRRKRDGSFKVPPGDFVWTCFTSDFLLEDADEWRYDAWRMMKERTDVSFLFITKRIGRLMACVPPDWGDGYDNVRICCTVENQRRACERLEIFREAPVKHKSIVCEPLLSGIDLSPYLGGWVRQVVVGGESGEEARPCRYDWVLDIRRQCLANHVPFRFKQTGARFIKDGRCYRIQRRFQHSQAKKAGIDFAP